MFDYIPRLIDINEDIKTFSIKQGDNNSRKIFVTLKDRDNPNETTVNLNGCTVRAYFALPDGSSAYVDGAVESAEDGVISVTLPSGVTAQNGTVLCEINISDSENETLLSLHTIKITVIESIRDVSAIEASDEFTALDNALIKVDAANARIDSIIAGETSGDVGTELADARIGYDGTVYGSTGTAIREQIAIAMESGGATEEQLALIEQNQNYIADVKEDLTNFEYGFYYTAQLLNADTFIHGSLYYANGGVWGNMPEWKRYPYISLTPGVVYTIVGAHGGSSGVKRKDGSTTTLNDLAVSDGQRLYFAVDEDGASLYISAPATANVMLLRSSDNSKVTTPEEYFEGYIIKSARNGMNFADISGQLGKLVSAYYRQYIRNFYILSDKSYWSSANDLSYRGSSGFHAVSKFRIPAGTYSYSANVQPAFSYIVYDDGTNEHLPAAPFTLTESAVVGLTVLTNEDTAVFFDYKKGIIPLQTDDIFSIDFNTDLVKVNVLGEKLDFVNTVLKTIADHTGAVGVYADGKITQTHTGSGNNWWLINLMPSEVTSNFVRVKLTLDQLDGSIVVYCFTRKSDGTQRFNEIQSITTPGEYIIDIDLNHFVVYAEADLSKDISIAFANGSAELTAVYSKVDICDRITQLDESKTLVETLGIIDEKANEAMNTAVAASSNLKLKDQYGTAYFLQVTNGQVVATPFIPKKILYIGNSLLVGFGTFGMAASNSREDYYYRVNKYLADIGNAPTTSKLSGGAYEGCTTSVDQDTWLSGTLHGNLSDDIDLVIIQLGDNVNTEAKLAMWEEGTKKLIRYIRTYAPKARVAWVGEWYSSATKQTYIANACAETGAVFIDISRLPGISGNRNAVGNVWTDDNGVQHTIDNTGVASHPSSKGFEAIAEKIIEALF